MRVLGIITARGGSKGILRKNVVSLLGKPLLAYTAEAALASRKLTRTVLSTDDEKIANIGRQCGVDVPFPRPAELGEGRYAYTSGAAGRGPETRSHG